MSTMARPRRLRWNTRLVTSLMDEHDIVSREELASRVPGVSRSTLYRAFNGEWSGEASTHMVIAMCEAFDVDLNKLVLEPRQQ